MTKLVDMNDPAYRERFYDRSLVVYGDQEIAQASEIDLLLPIVDPAELPPVPTEELWHEGFAED